MKKKMAAILAGLCAVSVMTAGCGYDDTSKDVTKIDVVFRSAGGTVTVCRNGAGVPFSEELAARVLHEQEIDILIDLNDGEASATAWGCDLTYDYVKINGDYRT